MEPTAGPILGLEDEDIGLCDLCGSEGGSRHRTVLVRTFEGQRCRVMAWLCRPCARAERGAKT